MRIDSSTIGMESARKYTSISGRATKLTITTGRQSLQDGAGALLKNMLGGDMESEEKQTKENEKENSENTLQNTLEQMRSKAGNASMGRVRGTDVMGIRESLMEIRQQCLNYLMSIFFPSKKSFDWNELSGSNESDFTQQGIQPDYIHAGNVDFHSRGGNENFYLQLSVLPGRNGKYRFYNTGNCKMCRWKRDQL